MTPIRLTAIVLLGSCILALAACGGSKKTASPTSTLPAATATSSSANTPAATGTPATTEQPFQGARNPIEVPGPTAPPVLTLTDVRTGGHTDYDRITFEFTPAMPGYRVQYVTSPTQCASGEAVPLTGQQAALEVHLTPAAAHNDQGAPTFQLNVLTPSLPSIVKAVRTCDFEADVTWVLILTQQVDFRIIALSSPYRLAVDVAHP